MEITEEKKKNEALSAWWLLSLSDGFRSAFHRSRPTMYVLSIFASGAQLIKDMTPISTSNNPQQFLQANTVKHGTPPPLPARPSPPIYQVNSSLAKSNKPASPSLALSNWLMLFQAGETIIYPN
jgi:hypothetical protein